MLDSGVAQYRSGQYTQAIQTWENALKQLDSDSETTGLRTMLLENLARTYQQIGQTAKAIEYWNRLIELHKQNRDQPQLGRILTEKAQALSRQGQSQNAVLLLCDSKELDLSKCSKGSAIGIAKAHKDQRTRVAALGSLGEALRLQGNYDRAKDVLLKTLDLAQQEKFLGFQAAANNSLGNTYSNLALNRYRKVPGFKVQDLPEAKTLEAAGNKFDRQALKHYRASLELAKGSGNRVDHLKTLTNLIPIYSRLNQMSSKQRTWQQAAQLLEQLPDSRVTAYSAIDLAQALNRNRPTEALQPNQRCVSVEKQPQARRLLQRGRQIAQNIQDNRALSFALGNLGNLAECAQQYNQAMNYAQQAILAAEQNLADRDSLYLWEWQRGRIFKARGQTQAAIAAYERSIDVLEKVRKEMLNARRDVQFDFRDAIDPIYRELIQIQLDQETPVSVPVAALPETGVKTAQQSGTRSKLDTTLGTLDALKLAELQNYFGNDCVIEVADNRIDERLNQAEQKDTAVFTTVIGDDRTAVIISLPGGERKFSWINQPRSVVERTVDNYRLGLEDFSTALAGYDTKLAEQLHAWLIEPFAQDLEAAGIKTLVFVQDGILRTVPMAALHDGKEFLIEKYAIAAAPSLSLVDVKPIDRDNLNVLAMGYTKEAKIDGTTFSALGQVKQELAGIAEQVPRLTQLVDDKFNRAGLAEELQRQRYSVLHIATHGKFGADAEDTFFIIGDDQNQKFNLNELDQLLRDFSKNTEPLDLLVLTACETAIGDNRAALGLAGVAVQAGASSAMASLWSINDATASELSMTFYGQLKNRSLNKAQALQQSQINMIKQGGATAHPYYWSAFVLVGNWL
ncbi:CHAT domain-containing protein [filamentous cyanobacterium LEGE 11480]|uniref:CHAT domain-containing protein n=1 Tax=Romeriopsis navalis LEGE 11480 TaxID=2777977 RepID=A0A928VM97_9CYAN|nr:CHAT domain-containing protein [Romeriopsis navalis]MBE9031213.1 CHAT domain-containing protein [Romeriopsis navalis LEGE 11480]